MARHILGAPRMSRLEKIIFVADYIEENRNFPAARQIRKLIYQNKTLPKHKLLQSAVVKKAQFMLRYARQQNWQIHSSLRKLASQSY